MLPSDLKQSLSLVTECGNPPSVTNANWSSEEKALNTEVIYRCKEGYLPSSPQSIQCLSNGSWSQPNPLCGILVNTLSLIPIVALHMLLSSCRQVMWKLVSKVCPRIHCCVKFSKHKIRW